VDYSRRDSTVVDPEFVPRSSCQFTVPYTRGRGPSVPMDENVLVRQGHSEVEGGRCVTREDVQVTMTPGTLFASGSLDPVQTRDRLASAPRVTRC
jgi:hypothetical protein